jgi:hypothetical protein
MSKKGFMRYLLRIIGDAEVLRSLLENTGCGNCLGRGFTGKHLDGRYIVCSCVQKRYFELCREGAQSAMVVN